MPQKPAPITLKWQLFQRIEHPVLGKVESRKSVLLVCEIDLALRQGRCVSRRPRRANFTGVIGSLAERVGGSECQLTPQTCRPQFDLQTVVIGIACICAFADEGAAAAM